MECDKILLFSSDYPTGFGDPRWLVNTCTRTRPRKRHVPSGIKTHLPDTVPPRGQCGCSEALTKNKPTTQTSPAQARAAVRRRHHRRNPPGAHKLVPHRAHGVGVYNVSGAFYAIANYCPHEGGPLCSGRPWTQRHRQSVPRRFGDDPRPGYIFCPGISGVSSWPRVPLR